jgi:hypothetical protein
MCPRSDTRASPSLPERRIGIDPIAGMSAGDEIRMRAMSGIHLGKPVTKPRGPYESGAFPCLVRAPARESALPIVGEPLRVAHPAVGFFRRILHGQLVS